MHFVKAMLALLRKYGTSTVAGWLHLIRKTPQCNCATSCNRAHLLNPPFTSQLHNSGQIDRWRGFQGGLDGGPGGSQLRRVPVREERLLHPQQAALQPGGQLRRRGRLGRGRLWVRQWLLLNCGILCRDVEHSHHEYCNCTYVVIAWMSLAYLGGNREGMTASAGLWRPGDDWNRLGRQWNWIWGNEAWDFGVYLLGKKWSMVLSFLATYVYFRTN